MEQARTNRKGLVALKILSPMALVVVVVAAVLASSRGATAAGVTPPPDGRYEKVTVEGRTVPMIAVMEGGAVVLVGHDGKKPRGWEEQFKRKGDLPNGMYNVHKTNVNGNDTFEDDPIDRQGTWVIDDKGRIIAR